MAEDRVKSFLDRMILATRQSGAIANMLKGRVANEGKAAEVFPDDSARLAAQRSAKTLVDEIVQEILLLAAADVLDSRMVTLDAEEESPSVRLFTGQSSPLSLVIDPIDGTLEYLTGRDDYAVCVGLVNNGKMGGALVYFPARDHLYWLDADGQSYLARNVYSSDISDRIRLRPPTAASPRRVYKNSRVPQEVVERLTEAGFEVVDDSQDERGCQDALLHCLRGGALAYIAYTRQMRDVLLGAVIGGSNVGYALDWSGRPLCWPVSGRVPRAIFGVGAYPEEMLKCLAGY
jgi:fructose-1,6-bisphosphatase/inositol monophosphatase family enzyme